MSLRNSIGIGFSIMVTAVMLGMTALLPADEVIRIMAANTTSGNFQSYPTDDLGPVGGLSGPGNRIFQGLDPDIVLVQEMNVGVGASKNTPATYRAWVDGNFGTAFSYRVETGKQLPNGIVSRFPILEWGIWEDTQIDNREFIWAKIDIPGDKDLWAISVHLSSGRGASVRQLQAAALRAKILEIIPAADYLVLGGDLNTNSRGEQCVSTLSAVLATGAPYPVDQAGQDGTNASREKPYDWVIPDAELNARSTPLIMGNRTFTNGLVYDSRVTSPYSFRPAPILAGDSGAPSMQHMAVMRAFLIPTESAPTIANAADSSSTETDVELFEIVRGSSVGLFVLGADDAGEATLNYTWSVTSGAGTSVSFNSNGTNASKTTISNFLATGSYTLTATVRDLAGLSATSSVRVRVVQTATSLVVNPPSATLAVNENLTITASLRDQFNQTMAGTFSWSTTGGGVINSSGLFLATTVGGPFAISASSGILSATTSITVIAPEPWGFWKNTHFTPAERTAGLADDGMDPDADGFTNLAEYALGTNPRAFTPPVSYLLNDADITLYFSRPASLPGIIYAAETSNDLVNWVEVPLITTGVGLIETLTATAPPAPDSALPSFIRLRFERQ